MSFYAIVKFIHVTAISLSIVGFITRVILKLKKAPSQDRYWIKKLPHNVDTLLLASALTMVYLLGVNPFTTYWIAEKIIGLLVYIMLGMVALRWGKNNAVRLTAAIMAVMVFSYIVYVAHYKAPMLIFATWS